MTWTKIELLFLSFLFHYLKHLPYFVFLDFCFFFHLPKPISIDNISVLFWISIIYQEHKNKLKRSYFCNIFIQVNKTEFNLSKYLSFFKIFSTSNFKVGTKQIVDKILYRYHLHLYIMIKKNRNTVLFPIILLVKISEKSLSSEFSRHLKFIS